MKPFIATIFVFFLVTCFSGKVNAAEKRPINFYTEWYEDLKSLKLTFLTPYDNKWVITAKFRFEWVYQNNSPTGTSLYKRYSQDVTLGPKTPSVLIPDPTDSPNVFVSKYYRPPHISPIRSGGRSYYLTGCFVTLRPGTAYKFDGDHNPQTIFPNNPYFGPPPTPWANN